MEEKTHIDIHTPDPVFGRDIFLKKGDPIDAIGSLANAEEKKYVFRGLIEKFYENEFKRKTGIPFSKEFIKIKIDTFVAYVEGKIGSFQGVHAVSFADGILEITDKEKKSLYRTNAITLWNNILKGTSEIQKIEEQAKKDAEALRESAMTESLFGGSVLVKYVVIAGSSALALDSGINGMLSWRQGQANTFNGYQRISEILLRTPEGTFERIDLTKEATLKELGRAIEGSRPSLRARTIQVTERLGYTFDPIKKIFTHVDRQAFVTASELVQKLTLQELRSRYGLVTATEKDLIETRKALQEARRSINWKYYTRESLMGLLSGKVMHAIMWPVFFHSFAKRQTSANLAAGIAEWQLFNAGMKVGNKIGRVGGLAGRFLGPLVLGGGFAMAGHLGFDYLGGSQLKWEQFNGTDMYDYKRSMILHGLNLGAPEAIDQVNKSRDSSLNAAIPQGNWTTWFGKAGRKVPLTGGTGITPEIAFIQSRVHLGVDPSDWMGGSVNNRNKDQWNLEVSRYKIDLKKNIYLLIEQYQKNLPPFFEDDSAEKKLQIFEDILKIHVLSGNGSSFYQAERAQITLVVLFEVQRWSKERSTQNIADTVDNYLEGMYLNEMTFSNERFRQEGEKITIENQIKEFEGYLQNPEEKRYFGSILLRMQKGERIFAEDTIDDNPFSDRVHRTLSKEHRLFLALLKNKSLILWGGEKKEIEMGKVFALLLDMMSDYVVRRDSMNRLSSISGSENGGYWKESEWGKSLIK